MNSPKPWSDPTPVDTELLSELKRGVVDYDEAVVRSVCKTIINRRMDAYMAIFEGLVPGMEQVGRLFDEQEYFVPELLMCADTLYAGLGLLQPHVISGAGAVKSRGNVILGAIEGDIHDIGKNLVKMVFDIAGFDVNDLGSDVPISRFVKKAADLDRPLVCVSMMMSTCFSRAKELVARIREAAPEARVMVGGSIVTEQTVEQLGCDGTANDAHHALREAIAIMASVGEFEEPDNERDRPALAG